jgi:hypothetical protein
MIVLEAGAWLTFSVAFTVGTVLTIDAAIRLWRLYL